MRQIDDASGRGRDGRGLPRTRHSAAPSAIATACARSASQHTALSSAAATTPLADSRIMRFGSLVPEGTMAVKELNRPRCVRPSIGTSSAMGPLPGTDGGYNPFPLAEISYPRPRTIPILCSFVRVTATTVTPLFSN